MEHTDNYANEGYSFIDVKYTRDEIIELLSFSNMTVHDCIDIIRYQDLDEDVFIMFIDKFRDFTDMYSKYHKLSPDTLKFYYDIGQLNSDVAENQYITEDVMDYVTNDKTVDHTSFINAIAKSQQLSDERMMMYADMLDPVIFGKYQKVPESIADALISFIDDDRLHKFFSTAGIYQEWADDYLADHISYIDWLRYYIYPERVIIPYNKMDYFIPDDPNGYHPDDVEWPILSDETDPRLIHINNKHVTPDEWKKIIATQYNVYYTEDNYFVGYMVTTKEGYPISNHKFTFTNGNVYEMHSDITNAKNSFGFNLRSLDECIHSCHDNVVGDRTKGEKIILCKVLYEDVSCCYKTPTGYTIRTGKIEILRDYRENL